MSGTIVPGTPVHGLFPPRVNLPQRVDPLTLFTLVAPEHHLNGNHQRAGKCLRLRLSHLIAPGRPHEGLGAAHKVFVGQVGQEDCCHHLHMASTVLMQMVKRTIYGLGTLCSFAGLNKRDQDQSFRQNPSGQRGIYTFSQTKRRTTTEDERPEEHSDDPPKHEHDEGNIGQCEADQHAPHDRLNELHQIIGCITKLDLTPMQAASKHSHVVADDSTSTSTA